MANGVTINREALRRARLRKGWVLRDVSRRCWDEQKTRVDFGHLARYEKGTLRPSPKTLYALAQVLGIAVDDLVVDLPEVEPKGAAA